MDVVVQLIGVLAWPAAAVVIVLLLKRPLSEAFGRLSKLRYKELEAEFRETLRQLEAPPSPSMPEPEEFDDWNPQLRDRKNELYKLAHMSPRAAIMEAWLDVEAQVRRSAGYLDLDPAGDVASLVEKMRDKLKRVPGSLPGRIRELRKLRNVAVHETQLGLPLNEVMQYVFVAEHLAATLDSVTNPAHSHHFRDPDG